MGNLPAPVPLDINVGKQFQNYTQIIAIRVQDITRDLWFSWDKNSTYPNGYWDNAGGGGNNAPVGQSPMVTPGAGNLYISFYAKSLYNNDLSMALYIYDSSGKLLDSVVNVIVAKGSGLGIEYKGDMPNSSYVITLWSEP